MTETNTGMQNIEIPGMYLYVLKREMERVYNINGTRSKQLLQQYFQEAYDALENKEGVVKLTMPELEDFKQYVGDKLND